MTYGRTYSENPVELPLHLPQLEPTGRESCKICDHVKLWRAAYRTGIGTPDGYADMSKVTDCNLELRNHPHQPRVMALPIKPPSVSA
ncbi:hypothetical protein [Streptomyces blastmyceticus]|uniref:Uncharacterized protein n=1 Tax=Streptomyces blastmyceticus TaxID=68180 RepID=A0ABP3HQC4_9ACTN